MTTKLRTCVSPAGRFIFGIHRPTFTSDNFRFESSLTDLGLMPDGTPYRNRANFPEGPVQEPSADWIFEVPNAFPFRGTTYIGKTWADSRAKSPEHIRLPEAPEISFFSGFEDEASAMGAIQKLPRPLHLALAVTSTDPRDLCCLAHMACTFFMDETSGAPWGLAYERRNDGRMKAVITDEALFEAVANNRHLPGPYKQAMVLRPGAQGESEIVGEWQGENTHVFEYLRRNSYIPWGHYAANMANDAVRYRVRDITLSDMTGMRHLYYQRSYTRMARQLGIHLEPDAGPIDANALERIRQRIQNTPSAHGDLPFDRTLWGWNYGFDFAPSGYRLHASHQQIHQQYAMIPKTVPINGDTGRIPAFACGDMVAEFISEFRKQTGKGFFDCYEKAIVENQRMDGNDEREKSLVIFEDERVMVFVPKAQTSQWELQLMPKLSVGNIFDSDTAMRHSLDRAILVAVRTLAQMGARMITTIEYAKPIFDGDDEQRLLMAFLPKLPESPGAFSEAQLRWINGHYPEDFALACRRKQTETEK